MDDDADDTEDDDDDDDDVDDILVCSTCGHLWIAPPAITEVDVLVLAPTLRT
jgi:hypothetical protein